MKVYVFGEENEKTLLMFQCTGGTLVGIQKFGRGVIERLSCVFVHIRRTRRSGNGLCFDREKR